ncbi:MAG TPA: hypothetical protein VLS49_03375 [Usitatibacter sp.]|nr:hypothetical protein [Usitatibacter sp.]
MEDDTTAVLASLRARMQARARELAQEVRSYPSPIARCDEQLPGLIEARSRAMELARRAAELERERASMPEAEWRSRVSRLAAEAERLR